LNATHFTQHLQQAKTIHGTTGTCDGDDDALLNRSVQAQ
jgi:hypothetical protein